MRSRKCCKGSFTIEMAWLMPLFLMVLLGLIYLCFYVHNRAWLTAAAHEAAQVGCQTALYENTDGTQSAGIRARQLLSPRLFGAEHLQMHTRRQGKALEVIFDADTISAYGGLAWHLHVEGREKIVDPVSFIWKMKGLEGLT